MCEWGKGALVHIVAREVHVIANTCVQMPAYGIGERGAELIAGAWGGKRR